MLDITLDNLLQFVQDKGYKAHIQEKTDQVVIELEIEGKTFPIFLKLFEPSGLLQMLLFFPANIKDGAENDLARLLHLANKELDLPGFGMEENKRLFFYRQMLPVRDNKIEEYLLEKYLKAFEAVLQAYGPVVITVAVGKNTFEDVMKKAQKRQDNQGKGSNG
ncbi:MAG: YbjN domain-containing protein [Waddliaceae bacterium]